MTILLPTPTNKDKVQKSKITANLIVGTTTGLIKEENEDGIFVSANQTIRICIADGHWGSQATKIILNHWNKNKLIFPENKKMALKEVKKIEAKIYKVFGNAKMNPNSDFTPESGFIYTEIYNHILKVISYGDCRLLVVNQGAVRKQIETRQTWLGAFSKLGLRNRLSIEQGLIYEEIILQKGDVVLAFTDGVDQCVYGKDTLSAQSMAKIALRGTVRAIFDNIFKAVFSAGAEDNASLVVFRYN